VGLRITHLSTYDLQGGAALAAYRLHEGLRKAGHDSTFLVQYRDREKPGVVLFEPPIGLSTRVRRVTRRYFLGESRKLHYSHRPQDGYFFNDDRSEHGGDVLRQVPPSDVLHLHWVTGLVDFGPFFAQLPGELPVAWTLHDMNPLTGGCHHAGACRKFCERCGACPQLGSSRREDFSTACWLRKQVAYEHLARNKVTLVTPSRWLASEVRQSALMARFPIQVIPYGLDTECFKPRDREIARDLLEIPPDAKVLLFIAHITNNQYKGGPLLVEAVSRLCGIPDLFVLMLGHGRWPSGCPVPGKSLGFLTDDRLVSLAYNAANVLVLPTRMDNFPNTALEALACGIPVVAFDVGGVPEIVRDGCTGILVERGNSEALAEAIERVLSDSALQRQMSATCRRIAVEEYDLATQAARYVELYSSLMH
jgi:glycosyltransferase involved in cell wall biosynthesis